MLRLTLILVFVGNVYSLQEDYLNNRIIGGNLTSIENYPYMISYQKDGEHKCGGAILSNNVVITAAHCYFRMNTSISSMTIRAGSSMKSSGGQLVGVQAVCQHPQFNKRNLDYDVTLIKLNQSLTFGSGVQNITLQPTNQEVPDGAMGTITGWGHEAFNGSESEQLKVVELPKATFEFCSERYLLFNYTITDRMFCFGGSALGGQDACQFDSGGPLTVNGVLAGIISTGYRCAEPLFPGIYTKLSNPQISEHIQNCLEQFNTSSN